MIRVVLRSRLTYELARPPSPATLAWLGRALVQFDARIVSRKRATHLAIEASIDCWREVDRLASRILPIARASQDAPTLKAAR